MKQDIIRDYSPLNGGLAIVSFRHQLSPQAALHTGVLRRVVHGGHVPTSLPNHCLVQRLQLVDALSCAPPEKKLLGECIVK